MLFEIKTIHFLYPFYHFCQERHPVVLGNTCKSPKELKDVVFWVQVLVFSSTRAVLPHVGILDGWALFANQVLKDMTHGLSLNGVDEQVFNLSFSAQGVVIN